MKKSRTKDISLESDIQILSINKRKSIINYLDAVIALLGIIGITYVFLTGFKIKISNPIIVCAIICFVVFFTFMFKKIKFIKYTLPGALLVYAIAIYIFYGTVRNGFMYIWNTVATQVNSASKLNLMIFSDFVVWEYNYTISLFLIFVIFIISLIICYSVIYKPSISILFLLTAPILIFCLYFAYMPAYFSLELLFIVWVSVFGMKTVNNKGKTKKDSFQFIKRGRKHLFKVQGKSRIITTKVGVTLTLIIAVYFVTFLICYPQASYIRINKLEEANVKLESYFEEFTFSKVYNDLMGIGSGGISGGNLGNLNKIKYDYENDLMVISPWLNHNIYLKGYTGCEYTGKSWEDLSEDTEAQSSISEYQINGFTVNSMALSTLMGSSTKIDENYQGNIYIYNLGANKDYVYYPYSAIRDYSDFQENEISNYKESSLRIGNEKLDYGFEYFVNYATLDRKEIIKEQIDLSKDFLDEMESGNEENDYYFKQFDKYNLFVQKYYTKLPDNGLEEIKKKYSGRYTKNKDINACVQQTISDISAETTYDLAPGKLPTRKDFVEYFLYENKKGYCTHYASAAAVILRAMGVPTRYVEGYVIRQSDADSASITSKGAIQMQKLRELNKEEAIKEFNITQEEFEQRKDIYSGKYITSDSYAKSCEIKTINVKDSNAHAWVEVYEDNVGWIPVDVTPAASGNNDSINNDTIKEKDNSKAKETANSNQESNTEHEESTTVDNIEDTDKANDINNQTSNSIQQQVANVLIVIFLVTFLVIIVTILRHKIVINKRKKSFLGEDYNKIVNNIFKHLTMILKFNNMNNNDNLVIRKYVIEVEEKYAFIKQGELEEVINIYFKANFSNHKITLNELNRVKSFTNQVNQSVYSGLSSFEKIKYTYIKNIN